MFAALIFIIAASTDGIDGYLARKHKMVTNLGKLWIRWPTSCSSQLSYLAGRDGQARCVDRHRDHQPRIRGYRLGRSPSWKAKFSAASKWGKWKTAVQITAIIFLLINNFPFHFINFPFDVIASWSWR